MPDIYGPFDGAATQWTQGPWYRDAYARAASGVFGSPSATTDLALSLNGLAWTVGAGRGHVRGAGYERTGAGSTGNVAPNTSGNPRIDRLVLRRDLAAKTVTVQRVQGTPAATPAPPALTQVEDGIWEAPLWRFTVPPNSGTTLTNITDEREWLAPSGRLSEVAATGATAIQQTINSGGTYAYAGVTKRSPYIGALMRAETSFIARFLSGNQQQTIAVQCGIVGGTAQEGDHDATERIPGGTGSGEDVRLITRRQFFVCTDATFTVGYNVVLGTGGSGVVVANPRCFVTGPYDLI